MNINSGVPGQNKLIKCDLNNNLPCKCFFGNPLVLFMRMSVKQPFIISNIPNSFA